MDIRKIQAEELKIENFAFMDMTECEGREWQGQPMLFDGIVFGFCLEGELSVRINYKEFCVVANDMFICLPKHIFTIIECALDVKVKFLLVSPDFLYSLPISFGFDWMRYVEDCPSMKPSVEKLEELICLYSLLERYDVKDKYALQIRNTLMLSFILIIVSFVEPVATTSGMQKISRQEWLTRHFFDLMSQYCEKYRQVSFYADKLCVTPKRLSAAVKSSTGHTVQEWINEMVLVEAKRYLRTTDFSISELSDKLHFSTASSFVRFFRQHAGITPLEYRKG